jgi:hypothetical protein
MAYMNQERKAQLAPGIKAVLKKYGMKGSISVNNHSTLVVTVKAGELDIIGNFYQKQDRVKNDQRGYIQVNQYNIDNNYTGKVKNFLNELHSAMMGSIWYDKSDISTDYFNTAYYIDINIGQWNKPYELVK